MLFIIVSGAVIAYFIKTKNKILLAVLFGLFSGGLGSLDPVLKGIGIQYGGSGGFLPSNTFGWSIFLGSIIFGFLSAFSTQIGFAKGSRANILVTFSSLSYVVLPLILYRFSLPGFELGIFSQLGVFFTIVGLVIFGASFEKYEEQELKKVPILTEKRIRNKEAYVVTFFLSQHLVN